MAQQVDTFGVYVRDRLEDWGREFALHRDCEYLGHRSKDRLQVLIEHKGEMPPRVTGFKPLEIPPMPQQIEDLVTEIARSNRVMACVLRGYYCGRGRRKVERYQTALELLRGCGEPPITERAYLEMVRRGEDRIYGMMLGMARAA